QGRIQAWRWPILLPPDDHRPGLALPLMLRGLRIDARAGCLRGLPACLCRAWSAERDPFRQWIALRQPERALQPLEAVGLVAEAGYWLRAHPAWPPARERTS